MSTESPAPASCGSNSSSNRVRPAMLLYCLASLADEGRAQNLPRQSGLPPPPNDPLSDGIYVRSVELPIPTGTDGTGDAPKSKRQRLVTYDFRPAFPHYSKETLDELLWLLPKKKEEPPEDKTILPMEERGHQEETREHAADNETPGVTSQHSNVENESPEEAMVLEDGDVAAANDDVAAVEKDAAAAKKEEPPEDKTIFPMEERGHQEETREHAADDETPGVTSQHANVENESSEEAVVLEDGDEAAANGDVAALEKDAAATDAETNTQTQLTEGLNPIAKDTGVHNPNEVVAGKLFGDKPAPDTENNNNSDASKVEVNTTKEQPLEDNQALATGDDDQSSETTSPAAGDTASSEIGGSPLEMLPEEVRDAAQKQTPKEEEGKDGGVIDQVQELNDAVDEFHELDEHLSSVLSPLSMNEEKDATTTESELIEQKELQSPHNLTVQAGEDAAIEKDSPVMDVDSSRSFHQTEPEPPKEVAASAVDSHGEDRIISGVSEDSENEDGYGSGSAEKKEDDTMTEHDPGHAEYGVEENKEDDVVKTSVVEGDIPHPGDAKLPKKSQQEDALGLSSEEKANTQHQDGDNASPPLTSSKDANRKFVTGLDEIDKLFESVEVPDELDVTDGSSMQDVLVRQGLNIVWKPIARVKNATKNKLETVVGGIKSALSPLGILVGHDEAEEEELRKSMFDPLVDMKKLNDDGGGGGGGGSDNLLLSADYERKREVSNQDRVQQPAGKQTPKEQIKKDKKKRKKEEKKQKKTREFSLIELKKARTLWKFAMRKWEQVIHFIDRIFDGVEDDEDNSELEGLPAGFRDVQLRNNGLGIDMPNFDGKFGSEVDESFLKSRQEAMEEQNKQQQKKIK